MLKILKNILLISIISISALFVIYFTFVIVNYIRKPQIIRNLPLNKIDAKLEFEKRVQNQFSSIDSNEKLIKILSDSGFYINKNNDLEYNTAYFSIHNIVCKSSWQIRWTPTPDDRYVDLKSIYRSVCL